ncbi:MAG: M1 family metallopeptidase, partial [Flavobacteriales bacterium]|nr:M1 family metallopeptidase [Flavobacteriales bacterium]MDW8409882.1 M1 family metallopeptidase [Flavobacteriales bacterium]
TVVEENVFQIQLDLARQMKIRTVLWENRKLPFQREEDAFFILFPRPLLKGETVGLEVHYEGQPREAVLPPWDGGFVWTRDSAGNPWISTAVQGLGASSWWPCKDHPSDEPDSLVITIIVPEDMVAVSNGWPVGTFTWKKKKRAFTYAVSYPINLYNVCLNVGKYKELLDHYTVSTGQLLRIRYYPLEVNAAKAEKHFKVEVPAMLSCYERYFGPFPFVRDGFALVETPFAGMEHQSALAYGNGYRGGYLGRDYSGIGLDFDFIIVHEAGHEYWGNAVSGSDRADLWIHEGFCTYAEVLYVECRYGREKALAYINAKKHLVRNDRPILPPRNVNAQGSGDMYAKAALMLHTLRTATQNDSLFLSTLRAILDTFMYKTVDTEALLHFMQRKLGWNLIPVCYQYLRHTELPMLVVRKASEDNRPGFTLQWDAQEEGFELPIRWRFRGETSWRWAIPNNKTPLFLPLSSPSDYQRLEWDDQGYFIKIKKE